MADGTDLIPPLDRERLRALTGCNAELERALLVDYRDSTKSDAADLRKAVATRDTKGLTRSAHRLKGASLVVAASGVASACEQLEAAGRAADWDTVSQRMAMLETDLKRLFTLLDPL